MVVHRDARAGELISVPISTSGSAAVASRNDFIVASMGIVISLICLDCSLVSRLQAATLFPKLVWGRREIDLSFLISRINAANALPLPLIN